MKDKILNIIMVILGVLFIAVAMFKTSSKDFQNKVYREINSIKTQYLSKVDKNIINKRTESIENKQLEQKLKEKIIEPDFGPYMNYLQNKIKANWNLPKGNESRRVIVLFKLAKDGKLLSLKVFNPSGVLSADAAALKAIRIAAPFKPLPKEFKGKSIDIQFTFDYNVLEK